MKELSDIADININEIDKRIKEMVSRYIEYQFPRPEKKRMSFNIEEYLDKNMAKYEGNWLDLKKEFQNMEIKSFERLKKIEKRKNKHYRTLFLKGKEKEVVEKLNRLSTIERLLFIFFINSNIRSIENIKYLLESQNSSYLTKAPLSLLSKLYKFFTDDSVKNEILNQIKKIENINLVDLAFSGDLMLLEKLTNYEFSDYGKLITLLTSDVRNYNKPMSLSKNDAKNALKYFKSGMFKFRLNAHSIIKSLAMNLNIVDIIELIDLTKIILITPIAGLAGEKHIINSLKWFQDLSIENQEIIKIMLYDFYNENTAIKMG